MSIGFRVPFLYEPERAIYLSINSPFLYVNLVEGSSLFFCHFFFYILALLGTFCYFIELFCTFWHFFLLCFNTFGHFFAPSGTTVLFPMSIRYRSLLLVCTQRARTLSINCTFSYADLQWGPFCYYEPQRAGSLSLNDPFFPMSIQYGVPFTCMHPESLNSGL